MTDQQRAVFEALRVLFARTGTAPSLREICLETGIPSVGNVHRIISALHRDGFVIRPRGKSRGLIPVCDLPTEGDDFARFVLGRVLIEIDKLHDGGDPVDVGLSLIRLSPMIREALS